MQHGLIMFLGLVMFHGVVMFLGLVTCHGLDIFHSWRVSWYHQYCIDIINTPKIKHLIYNSGDEGYCGGMGMFGIF